LKESFNTLLKRWRSRRGVSQLAMGLDAGVSARHLSFLETGRARPSREMVLRLAAALDLPLRERNGLVRLMLDAHEPYPAFALDRYWDIVLWNRPLAALLADLTSHGESIDEINALDLVFAPGLMRERFLNWDEVASAVLKRLRRQVVRAASDERLQETWTKVQASPGVADLIRKGYTEETPPVLIPMKIRQGDQVLTWINTLAVFGATGEVTLDELVVESFFPGDEDTRRFVEAASSGP